MSLLQVISLASITRTSPFEPYIPPLYQVTCDSLNRPHTFMSLCLFTCFFLSRILFCHVSVFNLLKHYHLSVTVLNFSGTIFFCLSHLTKWEKGFHCSRREVQINTKREKVKLCDDRVKLKVLVLTHVTHIQTHTHKLSSFVPPKQPRNNDTPAYVAPRS